MNPDSIHGTIRMLHFDLFERECNIFHFITTRDRGFSGGAYRSFNFSEYVGDDPECLRLNRERLGKEIGIIPEKIYVPLQVHGCETGLLDHSFFCAFPGRP